MLRQDKPTYEPHDSILANSLNNEVLNLDISVLKHGDREESRVYTPCHLSAQKVVVVYEPTIVGESIHFVLLIGKPSVIYGGRFYPKAPSIFG